MNTVETWVQIPAAAALGRSLVHSLWEGSAAALALAVMLCLVRSARARYVMACTTMLVVLAGLVVTFAHFRPEQPVHLLLATGKRFPVPATTDGPRSLAAADGPAADHLAWLAPLWIAGVLIFHVRGLASWLAVWRLRRVGVCAAPEGWRERLGILRGRLRLARPVALLESCLAEVPVVIGYLRPVILMPVGLLAGLPVGQVEAILLHELAHIRRYDYLVNLFQVFAEGLLFYHPAVWWISRVIRTERENCCDDLVVSVTGGALEYATALTALESRRTIPNAALAATDGGLVARVRRLVGRQEREHAPAMPLAAAAIFTLAVVSAAAGLQSDAGKAPGNVPGERGERSGLLLVPGGKPADRPLLLAQAQSPGTAAGGQTAGGVQPDRVLYDRGMTQIGRHNYQAARLALNTLINTYTSSEYLPKAKLAIADSWRLEGGARGKSQAEAEYRDLIRFYPGTPEGAEAERQLEALSPYEKWVRQDVAYIITAEERKAFGELTTDEEREKFITQFWDRRNPTPASAENPFKAEHYRRIAVANQRFSEESLPGWRTDRGRIYIQYGPPDEIEVHKVGGLYQRPASEGGGLTETFPFEQWRYRWIEGVGQNVILEFVDRSGKGEYRLTMDPTEKDALPATR